MFNFDVDKEANFFYWLQAVSNWDPYPVESGSYSYYRQKLNLSPDLQQKLRRIGRIIKASDNPRGLLANLYSSNVSTGAEEEVVALSFCFRPYFNELWQSEVHDSLLRWQAKLRGVDLSGYPAELDRVANFLDSTMPSRLTVYLLLNPAGMPSVGHAISGTDFILLHPSGRSGDPGIQSTVSTLIHEAVHMIEYQSVSSRRMFKSSYDRIVGPLKLQCPLGYTWPRLYAEMVVRIFSNGSTGGYFRNLVFNKPLPTVEEMADGFESAYTSGELSIEQILSWIGLNVLDTTVDYIDSSKAMDQQFVDHLSGCLIEYLAATVINSP